MKPVIPLLRQLVFCLPALLIGGLLLSGHGSSQTDTSLYRFLPLVLLMLGGGLCLLYGRVRALFQLVGLYAVVLLLQSALAGYELTGVIASHTPVLFHTVALWAPLWFLVSGLWMENGHPRKDITVRGITLLLLIGPYALLAFSNPEGMARLISDTHFPSLDLGWSRLPQLPAWAFGLSLAGLVLHARRYRRPSLLAAPMIVAGLYLALPWIFHRPALAVVVPIMGMVLLIAAVVQEAFDLAFRDDLTGLPGRRALNQALARLGNHYTLAMVDVDHFKKFNDTHGHDAGDDVLKLVGSRLAAVGGGGRAFRYGGEEFTLLFDGMDARQAHEAIEAMRESIEAARMQLRDRSARANDDTSGQQRRGQGGAGPVVKVTVSIGVADQRAGRDPEAVIKAADKALYAAKEGGRNCVRLHGQRSVAEITKSDRG